MLRECPLRPENACFILGGPIAKGICEFAVGTFLSCGGDDAKLSFGDIDIGESNEGPFPNLKGGNWLSVFRFLKGTELVELFLERDIEGLRRLDLLRLNPVSNFR